MHYKNVMISYEYVIYIIDFFIMCIIQHYPYTSVAINNQAQALVNATLQELSRIVDRKFSDHAAPGTFSGIGIENEDD